MEQDLQPDQVLDGRYKIAERISKSGMASIYRATDLRDGSEVALKVPYMQFESDPTFFSRFVWCSFEAVKVKDFAALGNKS